ncbi:hypothetical protein GUJ93_ZPchr0011g28584 [Zizania palustris]|uniref:Uncharacterized protein n=1 Tax=Zizania palustris TaxID=103762 RepID=A0A8J5WFC3_ZIZPA|nr:hypothetical protein GUJ93_ZPchr0011g28584 [Zizania palustris]
MPLLPPSSRAHLGLLAHHICHVSVASLDGHHHKNSALGKLVSFSSQRPPPVSIEGIQRGGFRAPFVPGGVFPATSGINSGRNLCRGGYWRWRSWSGRGCTAAAIAGTTSAYMTISSPRPFRGGMAEHFFFLMP